ncbi:hypothetical protein F9C07_939 [Aspergillus flavus]|uniref:Uncharacterized protein n=1 Tax=Aspergillus flavus (strain ATCC 200026 / FGSC A1120 / IAM 13836 / NRRL 3357 / JCM 12722 / SRRC 167) TaxID=332952 RepID=A0A7U2QXK9_ASPFN|nr:hypothetical protein F9C07_939 [Aspergillus flavus]
MVTDDIDMDLWMKRRWPRIPPLSQDGGTPEDKIIRIPAGDTSLSPLRMGNSAAITCSTAYASAPVNTQLRLIETADRSPPI